MSTRSTRAERRAAKQRNQRIAIILVIVLILAAAAYIAFSGSANKDSSSLQIEDLVAGTGQEARTGDTVSVHYTGWLADGTKFDSSVDRGQPYELTLGQTSVIQGWQQGIPGMKEGGKRKLTIPPQLAYGAEGYAPVIPPNATLVFEIDLLEVK